MDLTLLLLFVPGIFICLTFVVAIHEAGHFWAARLSGVEVEAFSIGWGKVLWSWETSKKTSFRICLLPLGGYCKMKGEQDLIAAIESNDTEITPTPGSLFAVSPWKRIFISIAGPMANLMAAFLIVFTLATFGYPELDHKPKVLLAADIDGTSGSPAEKAGLKTGDIVQVIDDQPILTFTDIKKAIVVGNGDSQVWKVLRNGDTLTLFIQPRVDQKSHQAVVGIYPYYEPVVDKVTDNSVAKLAGFQTGDRILTVDASPVNSGVAVINLLNVKGIHSHTVTVSRSTGPQELLLAADTTTEKLGWGLQFARDSFQIAGISIPQALIKSFNDIVNLFSQMLQGLWQLITGQSNPLESLSGPIGIVKAGSEATSSAFSEGNALGWTAVVEFTAFINLALVLMNLLPIPALDGGSIVISGIEGIRRKRFGLKSLLRYQKIGALFILSLVIFTTFNDLWRILGN